MTCTKPPFWPHPPSTKQKHAASPSFQPRNHGQPLCPMEWLKLRARHCRQTFAPTAQHENRFDLPQQQHSSPSRSILQVCGLVHGLNPQQNCAMLSSEVPTLSHEWRLTQINRLHMVPGSGHGRQIQRSCNAGRTGT